MRASVFQVLASVAPALAQTFGFDTLISPPDQATYTVGDTLPIAWTPSAPAGKITLTLIGGPSKNSLNPVTVIASSLDSTLATFSWPIPSAIGSFASYGINLTIDTSSDFQYSNQFYISGGSSSSSSSASAATTTLTSTTQSTSTVTVSSSTSTSATPTPSGNVLSSASLSSSASPSKTSSSVSATGSGSSSASGSSSSSSSSSSAAATQTKSAAGAVRVRSAVLAGFGGALMAVLF